MASDYDAIRRDNERDWGPKGVRFAGTHLATMYSDRTHFIYELLQNAEDALARRSTPAKSREVRFELSHNDVRVSHFGAPFTEMDVRGICGIGESTKDHGSIGRFGIGFKSVYAFTDRPSISSGDEHFSIENFVWPKKGNPCSDRPGETVFVLPFKENDETAAGDIAAGLRQLGPRTLLFLRHIDSVSWAVVDGPSGTYMRGEPEVLAPSVRRVQVLGEEHGRDLNVDETWMIFERPVLDEGGKQLGRVEIAFLWAADGTDRFVGVRPVTKSSLVVSFPTIVETHLGFVLQGPYRTTPSRDNVHMRDEWNQRLVRETADLVVDAVRYLRDVDALSAQALAALPLNREMFAGGSLFAPIFEATRNVLREERVLPAHGGGYLDAGRARIARGQELRALFSQQHLADLFGTGEGTGWVTGDVTQDRTPELRDYLMRELGVLEERPEAVIRKLTTSFLEAQPDPWIAALYRYLRTQSDLMRYGLLRSLPLIRLEDGTHLPAYANQQPQVFLPTITTSECLTVRQSLCEDEEARAFLQELGLKEPDAIEEVLRVVLTKYQDDGRSGPPESYAQDLERILHAYRSDALASRKDHLRERLRDAHFVVAVDAGSGERALVKPSDLYSATQRLKDLFAGVSGVMLVDDSNDALRGEDIRNMLEGCGVARNVEPVEVETRLDYLERVQMRIAAGGSGCTGYEQVEDIDLRGLERLLSFLPSLPALEARRRAGLLWDEMCALHERRGAAAFAGEYSWQYYTRRARRFPAAFIRRLNDATWIPNPSGSLSRPSDVVFASIEPSWTESPFLQSKIEFKPPAVDLLAKEAGLDPKLLTLLKHLGVTTEAELRERFDIEDDAEQPAPEEAPTPRPTIDSTTTEEYLREILGDAYRQPTPPPEGNGRSTYPNRNSGGHGSEGGPQSSTSGGSGTTEPIKRNSGGQSPGRRTPGGDGGRPFVSYVGVHASDDDEPDPDELDSSKRGALEELAIRRVLASEPTLRRTRKNNAGYDLKELAADGTTRRWIEVKAMTGLLRDRPVGLSRAQFECARLRGVAYWLYVVERAGTEGSEMVWRIQDPAGKAKTFTFDHGWLEIAEGGRADDEGHTEEETEQ
ncbi:MAG: DUF3883 domain-containing protein [Planctomycetes bacterium]|nr:DUF3883 domain-containing protein [Planctomycetota bacterium]